VLDRVNRSNRFSIKKPLRSSARDASFHTKHASNANVVRVVLLDANSYLALCSVKILNLLLLDIENEKDLTEHYLNFSL
jgi:hypothetical protein